MVKPARKKLASKSKPKRKVFNPPVAESVVEAPPISVEAETTPVVELTNTPSPANNIAMEIKEEPVPEITLPKEEVVEQPESVPEPAPSTEIPVEEKTDRLSFLNEKPIEEKIVDEVKPKKTFLIVILVLATFLLGMLAGGCIVYKKGNIFAGKSFEKKETVEQVLPSPTPTEEPIDLTKYTIEVLNGSETGGAAGKLKDALTAGGFTVSSAGNATSSAFTKTVIRAKKEVDKPYLAKLEDFLANTYSLAEIQDLESSGKTDVLVIIGAE